MPSFVTSGCFPQHYAAASLKRRRGQATIHGRRGFSAALRCGLIEASLGGLGSERDCRFSAALRCGLIEARIVMLCSRCWGLFSAALRCGLIEALPPHRVGEQPPRFPQHYAAASLKLTHIDGMAASIASFSAALRCGLIEALRQPHQKLWVTAAFSAALRCGLIEA